MKKNKKTTLFLVCFLGSVSCIGRLSAQLVLTPEAQGKKVKAILGEWLKIPFKLENKGNKPIFKLNIQLSCGLSNEIFLSADSSFKSLNALEMSKTLLPAGSKFDFYVKLTSEQIGIHPLKITIKGNQQTLVEDSSFQIEYTTLPAEFSHFSVGIENNVNVCQWRVINPGEIASLQLLKNQIGGKTSILYSQSQFSYKNNTAPMFQISDGDQTVGRFVYMLKIVTLENDTIYSSPIEIIRERDFAITLLGKPFNEMIKLNWLKEGWDNAKINLVDDFGKTVLSKNFNSKGYITLYREDVQKGVYKVKIENSEGKKYPNSINIKF